MPVPAEAEGEDEEDEDESMADPDEPAAAAAAPPAAEQHAEQLIEQLQEAGSSTPQRAFSFTAGLDAAQLMGQVRGSLWKYACKQHVRRMHMSLDCLGMEVWDTYKYTQAWAS